MFNLDTLLLACVETTRAAGRIIAANWLKPSKISHKGRVDLVTDTDQQVEDFLRKALAAHLPDAKFLGEESANDGLEGLTSGLCWIVDPVDGTTNFAHRIPMVAVSVALARDGLPILGVVDAPMLQTTFYAARDSRAFCNGEPIEVSACQNMTDALVATGFPYDVKPALPGILARLERVLPATQGLRRPGSAAIDLCWVAQGHLDAFYEEALKPWDMAAGWLIVEEAGGNVTDFHGNSCGWHKPLLATNGKIHGEMLSLLAE